MTPVQSEKAHRFSLTAGGFLHLLQTRSRLIEPPKFFLRRRVAILIAVTWLPLLVLTILDRTVLPGSTPLPFLYDLPVHARLLLASPLLLIAEPLVDRWLRDLVRDFVGEGIITERSLRPFERAIDSLSRWRDSIAVEVLLLVLGYATIFWVWKSNAGGVLADGWMGTPGETGMQLSRAGWWYLVASVPISQFLFMRWVWRILLWDVFVARLARMDLRFWPVHPDHAGGLAMLGRAQTIFAIVFHALGLVASANIAKRILFAGETLMEFKVLIIGVVVLSMLAIFVPLTLLGPRMLGAKRRAMFDYGKLGSEYSRLFDEKWVHGKAPEDETILGSGDVQSLADIGASYERVETMRTLPFNRRDVVMAAILVIAPFLPLVLTVVPLSELAGRLVKLLL